MLEDKELGQALAQFRKDLGIRQEDITDVNQRTISTFENGRSSNYKHILMYLNLCKTQEDIDKFHDVLKQVFNKELV